MKILPEKLYLSIGDKESKTRHPILKTMQENTEELLYRSKCTEHFEREMHLAC